MKSTNLNRGTSIRHKMFSVHLVLFFLLLLLLLQPGFAQAQSEGTLNVAHPFQIEMSVFGADQGGRFQLTINRAVFDHLTERNDVTSDIEPGLAESWERPNDNTWVFHLRNGVQFHDGSPFTSEDVKATLEYFIEQNGTLAPLLAEVASIETRDDYTVAIETTRPAGTLPSSLTLFPIGPSELIREPDFSVHPIGTGPFSFSQLVPGNRVELEANLSYWSGPPGVAELNFVEIPEDAARLTALRTGEIDITWAIPVDQVPSLKTNPNIHVETVPAFLNTEILINNQREPLDDVRVRQALIYAIDKAAIDEFLLQESGSIANAPLSSAIFGSVPQEPRSYDPEKARELLREAGYPDGITTSILVRPIEQERQLTLALIADWAEVGINVEPNFQEMAQWVESYVAQDWDMAIVFRPTLTGDADYTLRRLYHTDANRVPFANEELDELLDLAAAAAEPEERLEHYDLAEEMIWKNAWAIYPFDINEIYAWRVRVNGFNPAPSTTPSFYDVTLEN